MDLKELGKLADRLEAARAERLAADKTAAALKSEENALKSVLIAEMEENELSSVGGASCVINRSIKKQWIAADWSQIQAFIKEHDAFDLVHKRLTEAALNLRLEDGIHVPGTTALDKSVITFAKART